MGAEFTVSEVAALVGLDERKIRKDVEHGLFEGPTFSVEDLVYFRLISQLGLTVSVEDRRRLHQLVEASARRRPRPATIALSPVHELKVGAVTAEMKNELRRFSAWKRRLVEDPRILGGEPVFPGTRTAVRQIGGLLGRGVPEDEVREDYPHLDAEDLEFAQLYARAYPKVGRPRETAPR